MSKTKFEHIVDFVDKCHTNFKKTQNAESPPYCEWFNTVTIQLDASDHPDKEYTEKFGVNFMDEDTLIVGDEMNNVLFVYQDENKIVTENITKLIHVMNKLRLTPGCIVYKKTEPAKVPPHIKVNLNFIHQSAETINNNFSNIDISSQNIDTVQKYLETYFHKGGMCSLKQLSRHPEWNVAYRNKVKTCKINICKSCYKKWLLGCCTNYNRNNRTMWVMVVGWHEYSQV